MLQKPPLWQALPASNQLSRSEPQTQQPLAFAAVTRPLISVVCLVVSVSPFPRASSNGAQRLHRRFSLWTQALKSVQAKKPGEATRLGEE